MSPASAVAFFTNASSECATHSSLPAERRMLAETSAERRFPARVSTGIPAIRDSQVSAAPDTGKVSNITSTWTKYVGSSISSSDVAWKETRSSTPESANSSRTRVLLSAQMVCLPPSKRRDSGTAHSTLAQSPATEGLSLARSHTPPKVTKPFFFAGELFDRPLSRVMVFASNATRPHSSSMHVSPAVWASSASRVTGSEIT